MLRLRLRHASLASALRRPAAHWQHLSSSACSQSSSSSSSASSTLSAAELPPRPRRSLLYVPTSSARKLSGALQSKPSSSHDGAPDTLILDLEDSVAPSQKDAARDALVEALTGRTQGGASEVAVRINAPSEGMGNGSTALRDARAVLACRGVEVSLPLVCVFAHNQPQHANENKEDDLADGR